MKCPRCGNEVSPEEAFCGQCGAPNSPPEGPTEMINTPPHGGLFHSYPTRGSFGPRNTYDFGAQPPADTQNSQLPPSARASMPQQPATKQPGPNQEEGFYQDATEAMSVLPGNAAPNYPIGQQPFSGAPPAGIYPTAGQPSHYGYQADPVARPQTPSFQPGYYPGQGYPQQPFQGMQGYDKGMQGGFTSPAPKQRNTALIILSICLAIAIISLVGFGTLYLLRNQNTPNAPQTQGGQGAVSTTVPTPTATTAPEPTPTPTLAPTATTAPPTPTPTEVPTAAADPGFIYCGDQCTANGFVTEYPQGWQTTRSGDGLTIQFANAKPTQTDQSATFKTPGATTSSAGDLVTNDLQTNFATKNGYTVVAPPSAMATIGGQPWTQGIATYQGDTQKERVEVYAINYGGKAYIIELQAPDALFDAINTQYFVNMIGRFQFH